MTLPLKPPTGITPLNFFIEERIEDLYAVIERYTPLLSSEELEYTRKMEMKMKVAKWRDEIDMFEQMLVVLSHGKEIKISWE